MLILERQKEILEYITKKKSVTVSALSNHFYVSEATIRRDLTEMEKIGLLTRTHGGAVLFEQIKGEVSRFVREQKNVKEKRAIAEVAQNFVKSSFTICLDSSSTVGSIIPYLCRFSGLTIVTTGLKNALLLSENVDAKIYLPGGQISFSSNSIVGGDTIEYLSKFNPDVAFLSCAGVDDDNGITETSFEQAQIKRQILANAKTKILLADSSKFYKTYLCKMCGFENFDYFISDECPNENLLSKISDGNCEFIMG